MKKNNGITLIALVVTIVVLLILASISIGMLTGDNGIINQAKQGKEETEISEEKEIINISVTQAMDADVMGNIEKDKLQEKLNSNTSDGVTEVINGGDTLVVKFVEKNRYYEIDKDGNIEGPKELTKDDNAGDLSKGGTVDGSEEKPFEINCIEDLVTFSIMVNGGNTDLGIASNNFSGKYVELMRTLDFKSIFSYNDYTTTKYGDLNADGIVEDIKTELTKTDEGCIGFTPIGNNDIRLKINFDGNNHGILNMYVNTKNAGGLFGRIYEATIKNVGVSGKIISTSNYAAGIVGNLIQTSYIENCWNKAEIIGSGYAGGICAYAQKAETTQVNRCYNEGNIIGGGVAGGIVGYGSEELRIINSYNTGEITAREGNAGGIIGSVYVSSNIVYNCYNKGDVKSLSTSLSYRTARGIGTVGDNGTIKNCYNIGILEIIGSSTIKNYVIGTGNTGKDENCYYLLGLETYPNSGIDTNAIAFTKQESEIVVEKLNQYIEYHKEDETLNTTEWKHWKLGEDGYPTFE